MRLKEPWQFTDPACATVSMTLFFSKDKDDPDPSLDMSDYTYAKKICSTCPHRLECAEWGIANETHGVWGGLTPKERQKIRRHRRIVIQDSASV